MKTKYRIVRDSYCGFEAQFRPWWWPFWLMCGLSNTHSTIEDAEEYARWHAARRRQLVAKELGEL